MSPRDLVYVGHMLDMAKKAISKTQSLSRGAYEIEVAVSDPIIQEVRRHLLGRFRWSEPRAAEAVESIAEFATHVTPTETIDTVATDPDDNRVLECAVSAGSQTIVTEMMTCSDSWDSGPSRSSGLRTSLRGSRAEVGNPLPNSLSQPRASYARLDGCVSRKLRRGRHCRRPLSRAFGRLGPR